MTNNWLKSILYSRIVIQGFLVGGYIAYSNVYIKSLENGLGLYNGLFNVNTFTQSFNVFIIAIASLVAILTAFSPRKSYVHYNLEIQGNSDNQLSRSSIDIRGNQSNKTVLYNNKRSSQFTIIEYALVMIFILCGANFLMSTGDLVSLFLSIELQSYGLYILATLYRESELATSSGLTYFLLGGMSSCFILLGSAILYVNSGITNLDCVYIINSISEHTDITHGNDEFYKSDFINFGFIILIIGFLFKVSAAPFHFWSPDVYDGIPTIVTTFVAIIAKISIFTLMVELVSYTDIVEYLKTDNFYQSYNWKNILILSSLMSLIIGSLLGLTQYRIKRLFAYSTISHVGFILLALSVNNMESLQGYIFYILQYTLSNLNAFVILVLIGYTLYEYIYIFKDKTNKNFNKEMFSVENKTKLIDANNSPVQLLSQLKGYFYINSFVSISFAITLFSFIGVPPLIGFFGKQMVLSAALDEGYVFMTLIGIITSVIGAVYYLNIVKLMFFNKSEYLKSSSLRKIIDTESNRIITVSVEISILVSILTMLITLFIFVPNEWFVIVNILSLSLYKF